MDELLRDLNPEQIEAVTHGAGPLLILAGPGTGKTRVVTRRVAHLVRSGADPRRLLAITFTNKAAGEMRERTAALDVPSGEITMATFHAFAARLLRVDGRAAGIDPSFSIVDEDDRSALLRAAVAELMGTGADAARKTAAEVSRRISFFKNAGKGAEDLEREDPFAGRVWREYEARLRAMNGVDFDDLLVLAEKAVSGGGPGDRRVDWRAAYDHVLVDEYQDVNALQYRIARALCARTRNLCVTGDPDQSIYRWRGADVENILSFERDFPDARVVRLVRNYRSTGAILRAADRLIANNVRRKEKTLTAMKGEGEPVRLLSSGDDRDEAESIGAAAAAEIASGRAPSDIAILVRTAAQTRLLEQSLAARGIAYALVGGARFWDRREVRDVIAYLRLVANPRDSVSFERIVNVPRRGIGEKTVEALRAHAARTGIPAPELARGRGPWPEGLARERAKLAPFARLIARLEASAAAGVAALVRAVIDETRYEAWLAESEGPSADERIENVRELVNDAAQFDREGEGRGLNEYLETRALAGDADSYDPAAPRATILTMHAAKGLEFPVVVVAGAEEGFLPHARSSDRIEEIEEERRLLFVAMTRAKDRLLLSWAERRAVAGTILPRVPSPFLREIGPVAEDGGGRRRDDPFSRPGEDLFFGREPAPSHYPAFSAGDLVRHSFYGPGTITAVRGSGPEAKVTVRFRDGAEKQLIVEFAKLVRVAAPG